MDAVNSNYKIGDLVATNSKPKRYGLVIRESFPLFTILWQYENNTTWEHYAVLRLVHAREEQ
jgi:hypothetical protein